MDDAKAEMIVAAIDAGRSFGTSGKEGMMRLSFEDGVYQYYAAGDGGETRQTFADRAAFVARVRSRGDSDYRADLEGHMFRGAHAAIGRGELEEARASLDQALAWGHELARGGLFFAALAEPDRDGAREEAAAHLAALDAHGAAEAWRFRPFGVLDTYLQRALHGVHDEPRYRALEEAWSAALGIDPGRADALYGRGFARQQRRRWALAAEDLRAALGALPAGRVRALAWARLVDCLAKASLSGALEVCREALSELPHDLALQQRRASLEKRIARR